MRNTSNIFKRNQFEEDFDKFKFPPTALKVTDGNSLNEIADNEIVVNNNDELLIRRGNELKNVGGKSSVSKGEKGDRGVTGADGVNGINGVDGISAASFENLLGYLIETSNPLNPTSKSTITPLSTAWRAMLTEDTERLVKDFGANYFDANFEVQFEFMVTGSCQNSSIIYLLMLTNSNNTFTTIYTASGDLLAIYFNQTSGGVLNLGVRECNGGTLTTTQQAISTNVLYYCTLIRDESVGTYGSLSLYVYSDVLRTNLLWTVTVTLTEKQDFQYLTLGAGSGGAGTQTSYGFISHVNIVSV